MHPLSLPEVVKSWQSKDVPQKMMDLLQYGGFPEPYLKKDSTSLHRWHRQRQERIVYSDIRDLENVKEISNIELLIQALPERVGSPLSRKNLLLGLERVRRCWGKVGKFCGQSSLKVLPFC